MHTGISNKMFTQTMRSLERHGLVHREVYPVVPPKVEYSLTDLGKSLIPIVMQLSEWGQMVAETHNVKIVPREVDKQR